MFIDKVKIYVKAGNGGHGCTSFLREKYIAKGGPDGGDGGDGGHVILRATADEQSLTALRFQQHHSAKNGIPGQGKKKHGARADNLIIPVPVGTVVMDFNSREFLADLSHEGDTFLTAKGGRGGRGNKRFATSTNRIPRYHEEGTEGDEVILYLELKTIADVGLVGYPNAGKSTFLNSVSNAKSKTSSYPFTTLNPCVGIIEFDDFTYERLSIADIPGLVDGASKNIGLGHAFLKHIERTNILAFVLDMSATDDRQPHEDLESLQKELELYQKSLSAKAKLIIANKMDGSQAQKYLEKLKTVTDLPIFLTVAELGEGVKPVINFLRQENDQIKQIKIKDIKNLKQFNDDQILAVSLPVFDDDFFDKQEKNYIKDFDDIFEEE